MLTQLAIKAHERYLGHSSTKKTHCKNGHEFTPENTYRRSNGVRVCQTCRNQWNAISRKNKKLKSAKAIDKDATV